MEIDSVRRGAGICRMQRFVPKLPDFSLDGYICSRLSGYGPTKPGFRMDLQCIHTYIRARTRYALLASAIQRLTHKGKGMFGILGTPTYIHTHGQNEPLSLSYWSRGMHPVDRTENISGRCFTPGAYLVGSMAHEPIRTGGSARPRRLMHAGGGSGPHMYVRGVHVPLLSDFQTHICFQK